MGRLHNVRNAWNKIINRVTMSSRRYVLNGAGFSLVIRLITGRGSLQDFARMSVGRRNRRKTLRGVLEKQCTKW